MSRDAITFDAVGNGCCAMMCNRDTSLWMLWRCNRDAIALDVVGATQVATMGREGVADEV